MFTPPTGTPLGDNDATIVGGSDRIPLPGDAHGTKHGITPDRQDSEDPGQPGAGGTDRGFARLKSRGVASCQQLEDDDQGDDPAAGAEKRRG